MITLRPYQSAAVAAVLAHFRKLRDPAVVVLPTGAGKSVVIAELARLAKGRVLVLAHVKELVEQNHNKFEQLGFAGGIYAAGLGKKDVVDKVLFGSVQSVARAAEGFFQGFSLLIIDECHRVSTEAGTQYLEIIHKLRALNPGLCILGLTATPYRLGLGWIYEYHYRGSLRSKGERLFKRCVYELSLGELIRAGHLTTPIMIDAPVACYDFSALKAREGTGLFAQSDIEQVLKDQARITPAIVAHIVSLAAEREGVMLFTASVRHAEEVLALLPEGEAALVTGASGHAERDQIILRFKRRELKYLVNVSVLTTGFDAPHVDLIAILRPTESVSLYQQIVGRGLRTAAGKSDCLILDFTGMGHNIFNPEIDGDRPASNAVPVVINCPECGHANDFWGIVDDTGEIIEHFGRQCRGAHEDVVSMAVTACGYRFRFKRCEQCGSENDIAARVCGGCQATLVDPDKKLREAMALRDAHVMRPALMQLQAGRDKKGKDRLEVSYYDDDGQALKEYFYLNTTYEQQAFYYNFMRMHLKRPECPVPMRGVADALAVESRLRTPLFVIARKRDYYWQIREKIFDL